jgi:hypothetical protein
LTDQVVTNTILLPGGSPAAGAKVTVTLVASTSGVAEGFTSSSGIAFQKTATADASGVWSLSLTPNSLISPSGTVYKVIESYAQQRVVNYVSVPASGTPHLLGAILSDAPASLASAALTNHLADTVDAHDASAVSFVPTGTVAATDVQSAIAEVAVDAAALVTAEAATRAAADALKLDITTAAGTYVPLTTLGIVASPSGVSNGVADTAAIQAVIDALPATGGTVLFQRGLYYQASALTTGTKQIRFVGQGCDATRIVAASGFTGTMLTLAANFSAASHFSLDGNNKAAGVGLLVSATRNKIDHMQVTGCQSGIRYAAASGSTVNAKTSDTQVSTCDIGFDLPGSGTDCQFTQVTANTCSTYGAKVWTGNTQFFGCHFWGNGVGAHVRADHARFTGCFIETNTSYGVDAASCAGLALIGTNVWQNGSHGVYLNTADKVRIEACQVYNSAGAGIYASTSSTAITVTGSHFFDDQGTKTQTYAVQIGTADRVTLLGNTMRAADHLTGNILTGSVTNLVAKGNDGYVTDGQIRKASGSSTLVPSATLNVFGTAVTVSPKPGSVALKPMRILVQPTGTFGAETLSLRATATYSDATTASVTKTFTATGSGTEFSNGDFYTLVKDNVRITSVAFDAASTINNSTATGSYFVAFAQD